MKADDVLPMDRGELKPVLLIVDGHSYAYRAFYAIPEMQAANGTPTNAVHGFIKMLAKLRSTLQPTHLLVVWDGGLSSERTELLPEYKAQRTEMPADLVPQFREIEAYLDAANIKWLRKSGVEADDLIAAWATYAATAGVTVIIASSDKDFMQLVSPNIGLVNPNDKSGEVWTHRHVRAKTGVEPFQVVDWLSLIGDTVDNIRGIRGVGPKTAAGLLEEFGSVDEIYNRVDQVKSERLRHTLREGETTVRRNQQLIRLNDRLSTMVPIETLAVGREESGRLRELCTRWGFRSLPRETEPRAMQEELLI